eukprot:12425436-Karenia_brevis.AAC.1
MLNIMSIPVCPVAKISAFSSKNILTALASSGYVLGALAGQSSPSILQSLACTPDRKSGLSFVK